jgi:tyrosyl-DNA phosphodiesterase 2
MERDALFVDMVFNNLEGEGRIIRLCNTHLESLALDPPYRPAQVALAARFMRGEDAAVHGALMAGDFNAIQAQDYTLHSANGLKDAYLELGGKENSEDGYTWGQQAATELRDRFGCSRMDKVFYYGKLRVDKFERFGDGIEVSDEAERKNIVGLGFEKGWITDHLGVCVEVEVLD